MNVPPPEHRRVKIITNTKLEHLGTSHPFTHQVDVLFPSSSAAFIESALCTLSTRYVRSRVKLADVVRPSGAFADLYARRERCFTMLSTSLSGAHSECDDVWCVDPRGVLTLLVAKETYERLGLLGARVPFKAHKNDYFVIRLPLRKGAESVGNRARWSEALGAWDERREREGLGAWGVVYSFDADSGSPWPELVLPGEESEVREVACKVTTSDDVHIPSPVLRHHLSSKKTVAGTDISDLQQGDTDVDADSDDVEDWNAEMCALFEWVGMASLGSQRLQANDRVDPYVALYERPDPSRVGSVTRLRWSGLISPTFLQSVIDTAIATLKTSSSPAKPFVAITAHSCLSSPVSYVSPTASMTGAPTRLARADGEDTWCLLATPSAGEPQGVDYALVESLGQYDTRWG